MYVLRSALDSSASFLVCSVFWILSLSFYFKFIIRIMQKQAKSRFYPSQLRSALDSFSIYVVISNVSSNLIVEYFYQLSNAFKSSSL